MKKNRIGTRSGGRIFVRKWMLRMKLLFILLVCSLIQIQAAVYSQQTKVSVELKNVSLEKVFQELERQTDCSFLYNHQVVASKGKVSVQMVDKELRVVLDELLTKLGLGFTFDDNLVIIKERPQTWGKDSVRRSLRIVGKVLDEKKQPMPGVTVKLEKTSVGTATNTKGVFSLLLPVQQGVLEFSFVGYKSQKISFSEMTQDTLRIIMEEDVQILDETVVVAYGTTNKREMTGAVSVIKADELKGIPSSNIANLLQGRVAGMDITNVSGAPGGGDIAITIRGYNSLDVEQGRRFSNPLWVVDGVPLNSFTSPITGNNLLADLNPDMIESIQILKDASSAAIYGSRAANGVIIVTTKKGKKDQDATFSVNVSQTWSVLPKLSAITTGRAERLLRLATDKQAYLAYLDPETNRYKYPTSLKECYDHKDENASIDGYWIPDPRGDISNGTMFQDSLNPFYNNSTNFFPAYYEKGKVTNANIQAYGGSEKISYGLGLGYYDESGILKGTGYSRVDLNSNLNIMPVKRLNVDLRFNASIGTKKRGTEDDRFSTEPSVETVPGKPLELSSLLPGKNSTVWNDILTAYKGTKEKNRSVRLMTNFKIGYDIIEGLNLSTSLAADYSINRRNYFQPSYLSESGYSMSMGETGINLMVLNENLLTYNKSINEDHNFNFVAGFSYQYDQVEYNGGNAQNSPSDKIYYATDGMPSIGQQVYDYGDGETYTEIIAFQHYRSDMQEKKLFSYFARLEYNYKKKYLLSASFRRDGSSVFGANNRWGTFPSAAAGWTFSEENFMKRFSNWFNFGKIRASWGRSGMIFDQNYLALGVMQVSAPHKGEPTISPNYGDGLLNPDLSWEETDQYDFGLDLDFFNYRLGATFDYYYRYTDKMLSLVPLPGLFNGYDKQWRNAAAVSNEGIELLIKYEIFRKDDLYWKVSVNGAKNWNRFEKSYDGKDQTNYRRIIGKSLNQIYAYKTDGYVNQQDELPIIYNNVGVSNYLAPWKPVAFFKPGDYKFIDVDGDGNAPDMVACGSALPEFSGGFVSEFQWRNFDINLSFTFQLGRHMIYGTDVSTIKPSSGTPPVLVNLKKVSFWEKPGDNDAMYPKLQKDYNDLLFSSLVDQRVEKVNWLKWKTFSIGYNLPHKWINHLGMQQLRFFISGENLICWDNYSGLDPETVDLRWGEDRNYYPLARKFTLGLTVKF